MTEDNALLDDIEMFEKCFIQAITEEDVMEQVDMTKKLGVLAKHLGQDITRNKLLPFFKKVDFHDETLLNLAEQLKKFIPLVGGYEHSQPILDLLKKICTNDETSVREKAVETIKYIADDLNVELTEKLLLPILEALASEVWFTSRCSAIALIQILYLKVKEERRDELRHSFRLLAQDDCPTVRRAAAISLIDFIQLLELDCLKKEFVPIFDNIAADDMDSVKVYAVEVALTLSKRFTENEIEEYVFKTLENLADNSSWRIRQVLASNIAELQKVIHYPKLRGRILAIFQKLIKSSEEEVRVVVVKNLVPYIRNLKQSYEQSSIGGNNFQPVFSQSILPQIALLVDDNSIEVKKELAKCILSLSAIISKETFMEHIMPMVINILELDTAVLVKTCIFEALNDLPKDVDFAEALPSLKKIIRSLIVHSQSHWRTRKGLLVVFMHISKFATKEYFSENIKIFYASLLGDPVFAVRRTAPIILPLLAKQYGITWASKQLIPYFKMFTKDTRYLYRYVPLFGINELINPSIVSVKEIKYLDRFKNSVNSSKSAKSLWKLKCMSKMLQSTLDEKTFKDILSLNIDDFKTDNISLYAGETLTTLQTHCTQDIFSYDKEPDDWYLIGLISLICREYLDLLLTLFDDKIVNVQIRSIFTINKIKVMSDTLSKELEESWVQETMSLLSKEELETIENEVSEELSEKPVELFKNNIETELMQGIRTPSENAAESYSDINLQDNGSNTEDSVNAAESSPDINLQDNGSNKDVIDSMPTSSELKKAISIISVAVESFFNKNDVTTDTEVDTKIKTNDEVVEIEANSDDKTFNDEYAVNSNPTKDQSDLVKSSNNKLTGENIEVPESTTEKSEVTATL